jgi:hypothetical protein
MKPPRRLFKRDRVTEEHETVPITLQLGGLPFDPARHIVQVPVARFVELDSDHCLRALESLGVRVDRSKGSSAIDLARNIRASDAIRDGFDSVFFIDSDILFDPADAVRLLQSPEPVIAGVYAAKKLGDGQLNAHFDPDIKSVKIGEWAERLYPLQKVGAGFLRIKTDALRQMIKRLKLPYCRMADRYGWPFFQPLIVEENGETLYLCEDYAFCHRLRQAGITPMADTSFRIYHIGDYAYGVEEASGVYVTRSRNVEYQIAENLPFDPVKAAEPAIA